MSDKTAERFFEVHMCNHGGLAVGNIAECAVCTASPDPQPAEADMSSQSTHAQDVSQKLSNIDTSPPDPQPVPHAQVASDRHVIERVAQAVYEQWCHLPGYVGWVEGGNSDRQDCARAIARAAFAAPASGPDQAGGTQP
jgi:hypothetical protein